MTNQTLPIRRIFDIINHAPEGLNPFAFTALALEKIEKPPSGPIVRGALIIFACIQAAIILCCVGMLAIPFLQGGVGVAQSHNWIMRRKFSGSHRFPYLILNNVLVIGLSYLIGGILFECYVVLQFNTMNLNRQTSQFSWIELMNLPACCATFIQAFTMLFISTSNPSQGGIKRHLLPPPIFNFFLIGFPAITTVVSVCLIVHKATLIRKLDDSYSNLIGLLTDAVSLWDNGLIVLPDSQKDGLQAAYEIFMTDTLRKNKSRIRIGLFWALIDVPSILFYFIGVSTLVTTVYQSNKSSQVNATALKSDGLKINHSEKFAEPPPKLLETSPRPLARSLKFLWFHYLAMSMALSMETVTGLVFYLNKDNLKELRLGVVFFITNLSCTIFILIAMIILLARIIVDGREEKNPVPGKE
ncbi:hypothetical protein PtB15_9B43 [Puccinia triticina]|nr:hypothetical protein PtB15_9B43 [Puccinia triticina]